MKTKAFDKKLTLNKTTVSHLTVREQNNILGGAETKPETICVTCFDPSVCIACVTERTCL